MRSLREEIVTLLTKQLTTVGGIKEVVVKKYELSKFINTCRCTGMLSRDDALLFNKYRLEDYRLDPKFKDLVLPRGVYVESSKLAKNILKHEEIKEEECLTPPEFMTVQAEILSGLRKSDNFQTNLKEASESLTISDASVRTTSGDQCHYSDTPFMPIEIEWVVYKDGWYNYDITPMLEQFILQLLKDLKA